MIDWKLIKEFKRQIPKTQEELFDQCFPVSQEFCYFLLTKKVDPDSFRVVELQLKQGEINFDTCSPEWAEFCGQDDTACHYAVLWGDYIVDFTWIQFDGEAPVPVVYENFPGRVKSLGPTLTN